MSKREDFKSVVITLKKTLPIITTQQRVLLLRQGVQQYDLSKNDVEKILNASGIVISESVDYFDVLNLSIEEIENKSESEISVRVNAAHRSAYSASLRAGGLPRPDGRTQEQWRTILNNARDILKNSQKRREYLASYRPNQDPSDNQSHHINEFQSSKPATSSIIRTNIGTVFSNTDSENTELTAGVPSDMAYIPAGEYPMGCNDENADTSDNPLHLVYVDSFYIDKYLVTNIQYKEFVDANPQWQKPSDWFDWHKKLKTSIAKRFHDGDYLKNWNGNNYPDGKEHHPVTWVSWHAAMAYAEWVGKRLPTEAEWEKVARGGLMWQKYPWGNTIDTTNANYQSNIGDTTEVGQYPVNGYEVNDMVGNVWEWCLDVYDPNYYLNSPKRNPICGVSDLKSIKKDMMDETNHRVLRGGSWIDPPQFLTSAYRYKIVPTRTLARIGFRCVKGEKT